MKKYATKLAMAGFAVFFALSASAQVIPPSVDGASSLSEGRVGASYFATVNANIASVVTTAFTAEIISGQLPPGLVFTPALISNTPGGNITGRPTTVGTYTFDIRFTQGSAYSNNRYSITVTPASTMPPIPVGELVCASYFRTASSTRMIQGTWTDDVKSTSSILNCYNYMKANILEKPNCAQPGGVYLTALLIDDSKHTYDMPSIDMSTEFVYGGFCPTGTPEPVPQPSVTVTAPNGGEIWQAGTTQTVRWGSTGMSPTGVVTASIVGQYGTTVTSYIKPDNCDLHNPSCIGMVANSFKWTIPGLGYILPGTYKLRIACSEPNSSLYCSPSGTNENGGYEDLSDSYFTITKEGGNSAPVFGTVTRPQDIIAGQAANFTFTATDADNDDLNWSVNWGDLGGGGGSCQLPNPQQRRNWTYTTSHTWANPGTYLVTASISDCNGGTAEKSFNVTVNVTSNVILSVVLDPRTPPSSNITPGSNIGFTYIKLTASGGDVSLLQISPLSDSISVTSLKNISIYDGSTLLGSVASLPNQSVGYSRWGSITFSAPLIIPNGTSKTLAVKSDVDNNANGTLRIGFIGFAYGPGPSPQLIIAWPLYGNQMTVVSTSSVPTVTSLAPSSGVIGSQVTISGSGFSTTDKYKVNFGPNTVISNLSSNGTSLTFTVPTFTHPACLDSVPSCMVAQTQITPGIYPVSITNVNGTSNTVNFVVKDFTMPLTPIVGDQATTASLQAQISSLLAQIKALQGQTGTTPRENQPTGQNNQLPADIDTQNSQNVCLKPQNDLRYRSRDAGTNNEVSALQDFLQTNNYLDSEPSGFFGVMTLQATKDFQKANGISPTGFIGPITRAKIQSLTCGQ